MKHGIALALGLCLVAPAGADQIIRGEYLALVIPTGSPVQLVDFDKKQAVAQFKGTFVLTGVYHVAYTKTQGSGYSDVWFEPDAAPIARLPYWKQYQQHASQITFDNTDAFLKSAVLADSPAGLQNKHPASVSGQLAIKVTGFTTGVECDWPWFTVHFLSVERAPVLLANAKAGYIGC